MREHENRSARPGPSVLIIICVDFPSEPYITDVFFEDLGLGFCQYLALNTVSELRMTRGYESCCCFCVSHKGKGSLRFGLLLVDFPIRIFSQLFIMSSLQARTGRQRQRYQDQFRLVAGCIPYRLEKDVEDHSCDLESRLKVLMISSPNRDDLVFPKGGWEDDETVLEAACREALEEAGVKGILDENPLGVWEFRSKSRQDSCSLEGGCRGYMFALEVTEELETWPEQDNHDRKWLTVREAIGLCRYEWMRIALGIFLGVMSEDRKDETTEELVGHPSMPVPDDITEHEILSPNCLVKSSGTQHLDESLNCSVLV